MKAHELAAILLRTPDATVLIPDMDAGEISGGGSAIYHPPTHGYRETVELLPAGYQ